MVILPEYRWSEAAPKWRAAEEYGFHTAWTYDHLGWRSLVDGPWFDSIGLLTAAATVTSSLRLGTLVASPNFRHPVSFARSLIALDDISDGRFTLGVGAGHAGQDKYDNVVMGTPEPSMRERAERFAEFVELTDALLTTPKTSFEGKHFSAVQARMAPGCAQKPRVPFMIAGTGPKAMRLAARFGQGWITTGTVRDDVDGWWGSLRAQVERFDEALHEQGRDSAGVARCLLLDASPVYSLSTVDTFAEMVGRAGEFGFTDVVVHWPRPDGIYAGDESVLERVASDVLPTLTVQ